MSRRVKAAHLGAQGGVNWGAWTGAAGHVQAGGALYHLGRLQYGPQVRHVDGLQLACAPPQGQHPLRYLPVLQREV